MKTKTSVSLSRSLLEEYSAFNPSGNISKFIEQTLIHYLAELKRSERRQRDIEIINANAIRFNKEAEENLEFQALP